MNNNRVATRNEEGKLSNLNSKSTPREGKMKITNATIIRWSGLSAIIAGAIFAGIQLVHPPDVLSSVNTSKFIIITSLKTVMSIFGLFAVAGLYARHAEKTGWMGLLGYILVTIFYAVQMCFSFIEPLVLPLLTNVAPTFVESVMGMSSGAGGTMNLGAFATIFSIMPLLYLAGLVLFGFAMFRARILSRWASLLLAVSGPLALVMVALLPHQLERLAAIPMGIALIWLGISLLTERRAQVSETLPGIGKPQFSPVGIK